MINTVQQVFIVYPTEGFSKIAAIPTHWEPNEKQQPVNGH